MRIKPRFYECIPPINSKYVGFYLTFDEIYGPIRHLGVEQYCQLWSHGTKKGESKLFHSTLFVLRLKMIPKKLEKKNV